MPSASRTVMGIDAGSISGAFGATEVDDINPGVLVAASPWVRQPSKMRMAAACQPLMTNLPINSFTEAW